MRRRPGQQEKCSGHDTEVAANFLQACHSQAVMWASVLEEREWVAAADKLQSIVAAVAEGWRGGKPSTELDGYAQGQLLNKLMLVCLQCGKLQVDWSQVSLSELAKFVPDQHAWLQQLHNMTAAEASNLFFDRPDWGMFICMFASLWHDVLQHRHQGLESMLDRMATPAFEASVRALPQATGHNVCPWSKVPDLLRAR